MESEIQYEQLIKVCRQLPPSQGNYHENDFVMNLLSTVLDYQMNRTTLANAESHYKGNHWHRIRTREDLAAFLSKYPSDAEGNRAAAYSIWGYRYGNRLQQK